MPVFRNHSHIPLPHKVLLRKSHQRVRFYHEFFFAKGIRTAISSRLAGKSPRLKYFDQQQVFAAFGLCRLIDFEDGFCFATTPTFPLPAQGLPAKIAPMCFASSITEFFFSGVSGPI